MRTQYTCRHCGAIDNRLYLIQRRNKYQDTRLGRVQRHPRQESVWQHIAFGLLALAATAVWMFV